MIDVAQGASFHFSAIGEVLSPYDEKFAIPRQSGLVDIESELHFYEPYCEPAAFDGLASVSHLWVQFVFDGHKQETDKTRLKIRPPRLGGNQRLGVFASRSSFRPNPLGLSLVKLLALEIREGKAVLRVSGLDLLNRTAILDIKPYVPYADTAALAINAIAPTAPLPRLACLVSENVKTQLQSLNPRGLSQSGFLQAVEALISLDPRPAYQQDKPQPGRIYGFVFAGLNVQFQVESVGQAGDLDDDLDDELGALEQGKAVARIINIESADIDGQADDV